MYSLKWAQYVYLKINKSEQQTNLDSNKKSSRFNEIPKRQMYKKDKMYRRHIAKSIGSPPSNERFDYFSHFHEYKSECLSI